MKQGFDIFKWCFALVVVTVCFVVIFTFVGIYVLKSPTTEANAPLRSAMINLVVAMWTLIAMILGYKLKEVENKLKNNSDE